MAVNQCNPLAAGITGVILVALFTIPTLLAVISQTRQPKPKSRTYQDKDGISREGLDSKATATIPKSLVLGLTILGLATSITLAVLTESETHSAYTLREDWLNFGQWVRHANAID